MTDATRLPSRWAVSHWWDDPFSRGAWSLLRPGASPETRRLLGEPFAGCVVLAGEATTADDAAMVHGAAAEGRRAARWAAGAGHRRVLVIGAGAAGLSAADELRGSGVDAVVLEARSRIGGRVHSTPLAGTVVELGANWLQQRQRNQLTDVARALDLTLIDTDFGNPLELGPAFRRVSARDGEVLEELRRRCVAAPRWANLGDLVDEWKREMASTAGATNDYPAAIDRIVDAEISLDAGAPLRELSAVDGVEPGVGDGDRWVLGGYRQLLEPLTKDLDLRFETVVRSVQVVGADTAEAHRHGAVVVGIADGSVLRADAVIVTVPVSVLREGAIAFTPQLPDPQRSALALLATGRVEKLALQFDERWWPRSPSGYLRQFGEHPGEVCEWLDLTDPVGVPTITGTFVGPWLEQLWDRPGGDEAIAVAASLLLAEGVAQYGT